VDAFLLGAGFSIAVASPAMPSTDELGDRAVRMLRALHQARAGGHSDICDGLSCDRPQLVTGGLPAPNFEIWLSRLAEPQPYFYENENDHARALYREVANAVAHEVRLSTDQACKQSVPSPDSFPALVRAWHERRCDVITLNYDTLVESLVDALAIPLAEPERLTYRRIGPPLLPYWQSGGYNGARLAPAETFRYMKLHGSIHWYWDETTRAADSMVDVGLPSLWGTGSDPEWNPNYRAPGKTAVIVPPTTVKSPFFENPTIRFLWRSAFEAVRACDRLFVIGYSMPDYDLLVASMLIEAASRPHRPAVNSVHPISE
jgi:hypothetical protein